MKTSSLRSPTFLGANLLAPGLLGCGETASDKAVLAPAGQSPVAPAPASSEPLPAVSGGAQPESQSSPPTPPAESLPLDAPPMAQGGAPTVEGPATPDAGSGAAGGNATSTAGSMGFGGERAGGGGNSGDGDPVIDISSGITSVPNGLPNIVGRPAVNDYYEPIRYLYLPEFKIHIFGTENVSDWTLVGDYKMAQGIVSTITKAEDRKKFENYHVFVITAEDPDVPGAVIGGHKNTGNASYTVFTQDMVCKAAVDTIRPNEAPAWRAWNTPVHEFGHGVELALGLRNTTVQLYSENPGFNSEWQAEYFAWGTEAWFDGALKHPQPDFRQEISEFRRNYFASIFNESEIWRPSCEGRPE